MWGGDTVRNGRPMENTGLVDLDPPPAFAPWTRLPWTGAPQTLALAPALYGDWPISPPSVACSWPIVFPLELLAPLGGVPAPPQVAV